MSIPRLFTESPLAEGAAVDALPGQGRYLAGVLRRGPGDPLVLFNGVDGEFAAILASVRRDEARFEVGPRLRPHAPAAGPRLLLAALKRDAMEWAVQKATELGASAILPVLAVRCVAGRVNAARLTLIAREAAEQCERVEVPAVAEAAPLHAVLDAWARDGAAREGWARAGKVGQGEVAGGPAPMFLLAERGAAAALPSAARARAGSPGAPPGLLVGPEGGFTPAELDALRRRPFVVPAALGARILRAETAAVSGLAVLQACCGDWAEDRS